MLSLTAAAALLLAFRSANALERPDNVGRLPALGWNSWNAYGCDVNEIKIVEAAQKINSSGLQALGFEYVNVDDCWSVESGRDNVTHRIIPDPTKFPNGINGTAAQVHSYGLKMGIYSSAGTETCAGYPASIGYEDVDAETFAEWGIDYLKYDNCNIPAIWDDEYNYCVADSDIPGVDTSVHCVETTDPAPPGYDWATSNTTKRYNRMRDALVSVQDMNVILFSLCEWGSADVVTWGAGTGNSWRISGDINATWDRITAIANLNAHELWSTDFWGHNDPDMLEIGNGDLTIEENRSHYALWAIMKAPLIIGTDLTTLPDTHFDILLNADLVAFNQDPVIGKPAYPYKDGYANGTYNPEHPPEYWFGSTSYGWDLVLLLNSQDIIATRAAVWSEIPQLGGKSYNVVDGWTGDDLGCIHNEYVATLEPHDVALLKITGSC